MIRARFGTVVLIAIVCSLKAVGSPPAQERYLQANKAYEQADFAKALSLYETIAHKGPAILVNMGNAAYELGRKSHAILYWRQAQQQVTFHDFYMLQERIAQVHAEQGTDYSLTRLQKVMRAFDVAMRVVPHKVWQLLFFLLLALGLLCIRWLKEHQWLPLTGWMILFCILSILLMARAYMRAQRTGIVMRTTPVYVSTDTQSRTKKQLPVGQEVNVTTIKDDWYQVSDDSVIGWIQPHTIQMV